MKELSTNELASVSGGFFNFFSSRECKIMKIVGIGCWVFGCICGSLGFLGIHSLPDILKDGYHPDPKSDRKAVLGKNPSNQDTQKALPENILYNQTDTPST